jgi:hypothetical protein
MRENRSFKMSDTYTKDDISFATKAEGTKMIRHNLRISDRWLTRGLIAIYHLQTADEQSSQATSYRNNMGFGAIDAEILSSFAQQYERSGHLTAKQIEMARSKMIKYAGQLYAIASSNTANAELTPSNN